MFLFAGSVPPFTSQALDFASLTSLSIKLNYELIHASDPLPYFSTTPQYLENESLLLNTLTKQRHGKPDSWKRERDNKRSPVTITLTAQDKLSFN